MPTATSVTRQTTHPGTIGLALGGGAARGWAHIGVIRGLEEIGIDPDFVAGTSIGAVVGAAWATDNLDRFEHWVSGLSKLDIARFFALPLSFNGFVDSQRLRTTLARELCGEEALIEALPRRFATVATDLDNGAEIWLQQGGVLDAVWGSISLPGLFTPMRHNNRWLVDGGLVNPVPVSLCRALGAERVIAVNLSRGPLSSRKKTPAKPSHPNNGNGGLLGEMGDRLRQYSTELFHREANQHAPPGLVDAIMGSIWIVQEQLTQRRIESEPPELLLAAELGNMGLLEFHRGKDAIAEGRDLVKRNRAALEQLVR
ncbi:MAG: patatin-like phospholipase family protein [Gammaproteobacteria bacterium]|nr:patatin-like phospholipase family protein [Gammaproteobacteria bacterium]